METEKRVTVQRALLVAVTVFALGSVIVGFNFHSSTGVQVPQWLRFATLGMVCVALFFRSLAPRVGLLIGTVGFAVDAVIGMSIATMAVYTDNIYSATLRGPRYMPRMLLLFSCLTSVGLSTLVYLAEQFRVAVLVLAVLALIMISPVATGMIVREHRERAELERDRAAKIARLAEVDRRAAVNEERTRMARELHDTIANHLSAIAMRSSAVLAQPNMDAETMRGIVADIRAGSVAGLAEMRGTIELLRRGESEDEVVQHRLSGLEELVTRMKEAGLDVALRVRGNLADLPVAVDFAAYRIIQEALTNVLKHGRDAEVELTFSSTKVSITIDNRLPETASGVPGSGNGLIGMRERATILGGSFSAGPHGAGWRVRAELPSTNDKKES
ncbi:sensor histidine kinase [Stackebrandtia nassauensis]|uniref:sensor histidine kinase n=1 Tax=Stackebrandtia nassauensis TaxID=283811 RepID=UPI0001A3AFB4|nr:histidine kinase [Stackebrandtia nassauensis]